MRIAVMTFRLRAPWVRSLKEKRSIVKSLVAKLQDRFHVSAAEIGEQDERTLISLGVAFIAPHAAMADSEMDAVSRFIEENADAQLVGETRELR